GIAVALGDDGERHLAGTEAVHLDGARQLLQAGVDFGLDGVDGQRQRHLAFQLFQGFYGHGHDQSRLGKTRGARGRTRTDTPLLASGPKPGASTNFATRAVTERESGPPGKPGSPLESGQPEIL